MNVPSDKNQSTYRPPGLSDVEFEQYKQITKDVDWSKVEADMLRLLTHPETWVSSEQLLQSMAETRQRLEAGR